MPLQWRLIVRPEGVAVFPAQGNALGIGIVKK